MDAACLAGNPDIWVPETVKSRRRTTRGVRSSCKRRRRRERRRERKTRRDRRTSDHGRATGIRCPEPGRNRRGSSKA
ncbi:hypothetical protein NDU88_001609 [Pleurodeles waltl]|uniref:Uncharacterized protein n=1 Tax=Pleurodeles waltl TaxID=8319 RepID=A0AAV7UTU2_PLEWA|nr:hypothetical protein NDU88_001609 [Pleurodeles waltl]